MKNLLAIFILTPVFIVLLILITYSGEENAGSGMEASNIISDLRSMKAAAFMLHLDSLDIFPQIAGGTNACEYLAQYMDNPAKFDKKIYSFVVSGDHCWVGYNLEGRPKATVTRERLADKAESVGLYNAPQFEPPLSFDQASRYKESDNFVWMFAFSLTAQSQPKEKTSE